MKKEKDYRFIAALMLGIIAGFIVWVVLLVLKSAGAVNMNWGFVATSFLWITWILCGLMFLTLTIYGKLQQRYRRRKADARIILQAKAVGVWNTNAGGRALELYAKERGVKKYPGETDAHLRARIKEAAERRGGGHGK